jgi:hypothetical protein
MHSVYATLRYATLRYATLRYSTLLYATLRYSTLLYATLRYSTLLYAPLRYSTLLYATLRYSPLLSATLRYSPLLYATLRALQDCIVCSQGRKFLLPLWSPDNKATGLRPDNSATTLHAYSRRYMGAARLQWQVLKLHPSALQSLSCSGRIPKCMHKCALLPCSAAVAEYQTACACGCPAAVAGSQTA